MNRLLSAGLLVSFGAFASAQDFSSETTFKADLVPGYYLEDFNNFSYGSPLDGTTTTYTAPGNTTYDWTASGANGAQSNTLYSLNGSLSTNASDTDITISFANSKNKITSFGGFFSQVDNVGSGLTGGVQLTFSNGHSMTVTSSSTGASFYGYIAPSFISSVTIHSLTSNTYVNVDHVYAGNALVPEPMSIGALGLGALALVRRRKLS